MEQIIYITDEEREKGRKVIDAFAELYELTDVVVLDAGKYGFVKLQYYREQQGLLLFTADFDNQTIFYIAHLVRCAINLHKNIGLIL